MPHHVVAEAPRLRVLEVRVAGHQRVDVLPGKPEQLALEAEQVGEHVQQQVAQHEALGRRLLVVPAAACLEPAGHVLPEAALQVVLDLDQVRSRGRVPREALGAELLHLQESSEQASAPRGVQDACLDQHHHVREVDGGVPACAPLDLHEMGRLVVPHEDGVARAEARLLQEQVLLRHGCLLTDRGAGVGAA